MSEPLPILALHGWGLNAGVFDILRGRLAGRPLQAIDLPGHGCRSGETLGSDVVPVARQLLNQAPARAVWLGWSLGGMVALAAALADPERVAALVLVASSASFLARPGWSAGMSPDRLVRMGRQLLADPTGTVDDFLTLQVLSSGSARPALRHLRSALAEHGDAAPQALADGLALLEATDLRESVTALDMPALVIGGERDRLVHPEAVRDLAKRIPASRLAMFETAGHVPFLSHLGAFENEVRDFMTSTNL